MQSTKERSGAGAGGAEGRAGRGRGGSGAGIVRHRRRPPSGCAALPSPSRVSRRARLRDERINSERHRIVVHPPIRMGGSLSYSIFLLLATCIPGKKTEVTIL